MGNNHAPQSSTEESSDDDAGKVRAPDFVISGYVVDQNYNGKSLLRQLRSFADIPAFSNIKVDICEDGSLSPEDQFAVRKVQIAVSLKHTHVYSKSEAQVMYILSSTYCREQVEKGTCVWLSPSKSDAAKNNPEVAHHRADLSMLAFGTFDKACSFTYLHEAPCSRSIRYSVHFQFDKGAMHVYCEYIDDRVRFRLNFDGSSLHRVVHVTKSEFSIDAFFQMKYPPSIYKSMDVDRELWSRRSYLPTITGDTLGRCDVVRLSFNVSKSTYSENPSDIEIIYRNLQSRIIDDDSPKWNFKFTHVRQTRFCDDDLIEPFDLSYPFAVLNSVGLRGQLLLGDSRLRLQDSEQLFDIADRYSKDEEYYLIDIDRVVQCRNRRQVRTKLDRLSVKNVVLTPTRIIFQRPSDGESNRIFHKHGTESAMKVSFRDEDINYVGTNLQHIYFYEDRDGNVDDEVLSTTIVERLKAGIRVDGCTYRVLGGSNSMVTEHGYYLWAKEVTGVDAREIRSSIGNLHFIRNRAKYVARLGLAFSNAVARIPIEKCWVTRENDIKGGRDPDGKLYTFSDGIGKISLAVAKLIDDQLKRRNGIVPSAYQIRMGGVKGVLAVDTTLRGKRIVVRDSMVKFECPHEQLEIIDSSKPLDLTLNKQIVTILSQLGVPDSSFFGLMNDEIRPLLLSLIQPSIACKTLMNRYPRFRTMEINCYPQDLTKNTFIRAIIIAELKDKLDKLKRGAKKQIPVPSDQGRNMMGVLDETGQLEYGEVFIRYLTKTKYEPIVVTGPVIVSKMPALHPGDVRKLKAVAADRVPGLKHMCDVIVFPRKGQRPHPNEMAGSDLDGDLYFVVWREDFIYPRENWEPMHFPTAQIKQSDKPINENDIIEHLKFNILTDLKGKISSKHLAFASMLDTGIFSDECLELAALAAKAYDAQKTGEALVIPPHLIPRGAPDFMEKADHQPTYITTKILSRLHDRTLYLLDVIPKFPKRRVGLAQSQVCAASNQAKDLAENILMDSYKVCMSALADRYHIAGEEQLWMGRFTSADDYKRNGRKFNREFEEIKQNICRQFNRCYKHELKKGNHGSESERKKDMFQACIHLATMADMSDEFGKGLPWILPGIESEPDWDPVDGEANGQIGRTIVQDLREELRVEKRFYVLDYIDKPEFVALFDRHIWLALCTEFVMRRTFRTGEIERHNDILRHVVHFSLKKGYHSAGDFELDLERDKIRKILSFKLLKTYAANYVKEILKSRLMQIINGKEDVTDQDFIRVGDVVVGSAWEIYDQKKGSVSEEVKRAAFRLLVDIAFRRTQSRNEDELTRNNAVTKQATVTENGRRLRRLLDLSRLRSSYQSRYQLDYVNIEQSDPNWNKIQLVCRGTDARVLEARQAFSELCRRLDKTG